VQGYRHTKDPVLRNRIRYPLLGVVLVLLGGSTNTVPALGAFPIDHAANLMNALLLSYAILRYRLVDIRLVVRKGLLYSIPTIIIGAGYFLLISLAMGLFHAFAGPQILLLSLLVAVMTAVVAQPLRDRAQLWIDKLFFREKYDSSLMLQRLSRASASVLDLDKLTGMILDEVTTTVHIERIAFFVRQEESREFRLAAQRGLDRDADSRLRKDHPIVEWLYGHENALTRHDMEMSPQFKALWGEEKEDLERMGAELFIPLEAKGELVGILTVGPKLSEVAYSEDDQLTLTTLANQAAVAIENARLYDVAQRELAERKRAEEELKGYSEQLEEMVGQRTLELQKAYSDLRDSQARLLQSEKLAATGRLAASVAHEINNPLQGISNYLSMISQQVAQDDPLHEDLDMVKLGFERVAEIVRRLRAFYRPVGEEMEPTDVNRVVERVLALLGYQLSLGKVKVETELAEQELPVLGSAGQLEQVLVNLALNAQNAMPEGGELMVRTALHSDVVWLQVSDTGHGISEEEIDRLFKPFYSGSEGTGLGLGLWISHNIIEGHSGRIEVESQLGEGTAFTISLPAYQRER
jgi:signal transduction histidine kinase